LSAARSLVFLAPVIFHGVNAAAYALWPEAYRAHVAGEDRLLEWAQALCFAAAAVAIAVAARRARALGRRGAARLFALGAAACALAFLEEISWGQRVFDWSTPEVLRQVNRQGETNLHNLAPIHPLQGWIGLAVAAVGAGGWMLPRRLLGGEKGTLRLALPGPLCCLYFAQYAAYLLCLQVQDHVFERPLLRITWQEAFETPFAAGFLVYGLDRLRALRRASGRDG
jgi:hypothetical protein